MTPSPDAARVEALEKIKELADSRYEHRSPTTFQDIWTIAVVALSQGGEPSPGGLPTTLAEVRKAFDRVGRGKEGQHYNVDAIAELVASWLPLPTPPAPPNHLYEALCRGLIAKILDRGTHADPMGDIDLRLEATLRERDALRAAAPPDLQRGAIVTVAKEIVAAVRKSWYQHEEDLKAGRDGWPLWDVWELMVSEKILAALRDTTPPQGEGT